MTETQQTVPAVELKPLGSTALSLFYDSARKRWIFTCDYLAKDIAKDHGFWWDKDTQEWYTGDPFTAMKLIHYAEPETRAKLAKYWNFARTSFQESNLATGELRQEQQETHIPVPHGKAYKDYQRVGIEYLCRDDERCPNTLLGDEMGLGKTIEIIGAINYFSDALRENKLRRVLIVCPASLKLNWAKELRKWLTSPLSYGIADPKHFPRNRDIIIVNYDLLQKWKPLIDSIDWDLLVADEAHYLKNPTTIRSKYFYGYHSKEESIPGIPAKRRIYATGTPIVNRPRELFPLIHSLDPDQFPKFIHFGMRYCAGYKAGKTWDFSGHSNLDELQARLRSTIMMRRLKNEVLKELPPKTRNVIEMPAPRGMSELLARELKAYQEKEPQLEEMKQRIAAARTANDTAAYAAAVEAFKKKAGDIMGEISTVRREVALKKVPLIIEYLESLWADDPERKIVLWCHHHEVMDLFMQRFKQFTTKVKGEEKSSAYALKFSGQQSLQERDRAVDAFQGDPRCLLFVGQTLAGGVGITLTASSHCIFAELDWVPGNIMQAEDRLHRIGQVDNVLVEHLVLEGSLDCRIASRIVEKQQVIDAAMNTQSNHLSQHSMMAAA